MIEIKFIIVSFFLALKFMALFKDAVPLTKSASKDLANIVAFFYRCYFHSNY